MQEAVLKLQLNVALSSVFIICGINSLPSHSMNMGIGASDLKNLSLHTGVKDPRARLRGPELKAHDQRQHQQAFAATLMSIGTQAEKIKAQLQRVEKLNRVKQYIPAEFHHKQILQLAHAVDFSTSTDQETLARKYMELAMLIRDIYDQDNRIS